jgi:hypothetical protein
MERMERTEFACPFPKCSLSYQSKNSLKRHISDRRNVPDENHPQGDSLFEPFKRRLMTPEEKQEGRRRAYTRYNKNDLTGTLGIPDLTKHGMLTSQFDPNY